MEFAQARLEEVERRLVLGEDDQALVVAEAPARAQVLVDPAAERFEARVAAGLAGVRRRGGIAEAERVERFVHGLDLAPQATGHGLEPRAHRPSGLRAT